LGSALLPNGKSKSHDLDRACFSLRQRRLQSKLIGHRVLDDRALEEIQIVARVQTRGVAKRELPEILLGHEALFDQLECFRNHLREIGHVEMREVGAEHRPYSSAELATAEKLRLSAIAGSKKADRRATKSACETS
jgi:hypothetical protein